MQLRAGITAFIMACATTTATTTTPAPPAAAVPQSITIASTTPDLADGDTVQVCLREVTGPTEAGVFRCPGVARVRPAPDGQPNVSESALWSAVLASGYAPADIASAWVYAMPAGSNPDTRNAASVELYTGTPPSDNGFVRTYIVRTSEGRLAVYVGVVRR